VGEEHSFSIRHGCPLPALGEDDRAYFRYSLPQTMGKILAEFPDSFMRSGVNDKFHLTLFFALRGIVRLAYDQVAQKAYAAVPGAQSLVPHPLTGEG